ncbi:hypothetical protein HanIR_Chr08g0378341 [Helianthus annuus]|nr:hypothetical protein HanIR_Chr08g0378341 [Helianthus annuus]
MWSGMSRAGGVTVKTPKVHMVYTCVCKLIVVGNLKDSVNHPKCGQFEGIIPDRML